MRFQGLDLLRAAAILLVLGRHFEKALEDYAPIHAAPFLEAWRHGGWVGVDLFFALSGFLIGNLLVTEWRKTGSIRPGRFLARRAWKIVPPLYLMLGLTVALRCTFRPLAVVAREALVDAAFLTNYLLGAWAHTWSLALEAHFYLLLTLVAAWLLRGRQRLGPFVWTLAGLAALVLAIRACFPATGEPMSQQYFFLEFPTHRRIDSLLIGALLACAYSTEAIRARAARIDAHWYLLVGMAFLAPAFWISDRLFLGSPLGFTWIQAGTSSLVAWALLKAPTPGFLAASAAALGRHSYCIYLFHYPLFGLWAKLRTRFHWDHVYLELMTVSVLVVGVGVAISLLWEAPLLRLRERFFPATPARTI
ncbi:MAG TPA: acyltransferase [Candidatus Limnocylindria bacterium]|jgi:peptidoglycan/LPS O-acetylase OafA/YrhL|nr:acyltransferase [Candidatus Limnocylindria bacterium]